MSFAKVASRSIFIGSWSSAAGAFVVAAKLRETRSGASMMVPPIHACNLLMDIPLLWLMKNSSMGQQMLYTRFFLVITPPGPHLNLCHGTGDAFLIFLARVSCAAALKWQDNLN